MLSPHASKLESAEADLESYRISEQYKSPNSERKSKKSQDYNASFAGEVKKPRSSSLILKPVSLDIREEFKEGGQDNELDLQDVKLLGRLMQDNLSHKNHQRNWSEDSSSDMEKRKCSSQEMEACPNNIDDDLEF
jgi:hypothetical protein